MHIYYIYILIYVFRYLGIYVSVIYLPTILQI